MTELSESAAEIVHIGISYQMQRIGKVSITSGIASRYYLVV